MQGKELTGRKLQGGKSNVSRNSERNEKGKFTSTGGKKIGEHFFVKDGMKNGR